ncbi:penicillin-binding protein [Sulfobacillus thermotolerans]|uniref:Penicillin-binding protein 1A n=1 Tax=Sulfobacillus thermotolerans TaxID=338644 RepID=A0ABN5H3P1_9FIRM|nr:penicillin-binding protein [Sulfobacillus thermotolerans]
MESRRQRKNRKRSSLTAWIRRLTDRIGNTAATISLPAVVIGATVLLLPTAWLALPVPQLPADTRIYDQHGHLVSVLTGAENRIPVSYQDVPASMQNALVAIEDDTYWIEPAIDPLGITRAALVDITSHQILQGGSTITQQLAKNLYLSDRRTFSRKFKELFITLKLSTMFNKRQILSMYLNDVYFGEGAYGVEAASETYFGHSVRYLTLPEAALLAGIVNAPSYDDPYIHPEIARQRRNVVLARMESLHYITKSQELAAQSAPLNLANNPPLGDRAPYFTKFIANELTRLDPTIGKNLYDGGYAVTTTMNWTMQQAAQNAVAWYLPSTTDVHGVPEPEVGLCAINPSNGYIEALVGGDNYAKTQLDRATQALRQPGSTMKYFLYTTVIHDGYPTSSVKDSAPVRFPAGHGKWYVPHNYGHVYNGPLTIRRAIAESDNIVAVKWMDTVGPPAMIHMAHEMGITSPLADNLTTALGSSDVTPYEMARGVSTLANGGYRIRPFGVLKVVDQNGRTIFQDAPHKTRVLSPQVAYVTTNLFTAPLLSSVGTAHDLEPIINRPAAAKTGTSSKQRDAWLVGFTPQLAAAVWVGNDNDSPLGLTGDRGAGPIWAHFMKMALAGQPKKNFRQPPGLVWKSVCFKTGLLSNGCCNAYREVFIKGHAPTKVSPGCGSTGSGSAGSGGSTSSAGTSNQSLLKAILKALTP